MLEKTKKVVEKTQTEFNENLEVNYPHNYEEEKNLTTEWNAKIKRKLETKQRRKWIKFKNKRLTTRSNLNKESSNRVTSNTEVEIAPMDIVSSNEDQHSNFPSEEQLKFITDNRHQRKKNRTYADAAVNIPDDPAVFSTTNESSRSKLGNKTLLTSEELRGIYGILIFDEPKVVNTRPSVLSTNTSISENTSASYRANCPRLEVASKNNFVSRLDEELLSVLVDLQNDNFATGNSVVRSDGLPTKQQLLMRDVLQVHFVLKLFSTLVKEHYRILRFRFWRKGWTFHKFRDPEIA